MSQNATRNLKGTKVANSNTNNATTNTTTNNNNSSNFNPSLNSKQSNLNNNTNTTHTTINSKSNSNTNNNHTENEHNKQQHHQNNSNEKESLKPTPEQVRLASLLAIKSEDPEINKKIKQVLDIYPNKTQDEILMVLHDHDYDLDQVLNYLVDGGDISQDWILAGSSTKSSGKSKQNQSPNQTLDETEETNQQQGNRKFNKGNSNNKSNNTDNNNNKNRSRDRDRGSKYNNNNNQNFKKSNQTGTQDEQNIVTSNDQNINLEKFSNLDLNQTENNNNEYGQPNRGGNNRRGGGGGGRGGSARGIRMNNGRGGAGGLNSRVGGFKGSLPPRGGNRRSGGNENNQNRLSQNEFINTNINNNNNNINNNNVNNSLDQMVESNSSENLKSNEHLHEIQDVNNTNGTNVILDHDNQKNGVLKSRNDNLRDIGTWSNEQAQPNHQNRNKKGPHYASNNRFNNQQPQTNNSNANNRNLNPSGNQVNSNNQPEEWDDEGEWQGETQIFTASKQKKDNFNEPLHQHALDSNDFPIGHFNAEEATQKIKKAVGIGANNNSSIAPVTVTGSQPVATTSKTTSSVPIPITNPSTTSSSTTPTPNTTNDIILNNNSGSNIIQQQQQQQTNDQQNLTKLKQNLKYPPSSKPLPPPSTKIPKSAVIMPDGSTSNSTNFNLDVQFGVDLDSPIDELKDNHLTNIVNQQLLSKTQAQPSIPQSNVVGSISRITTPPSSNQVPVTQQQQQQQQQQQPPQQVKVINQVQNNQGFVKQPQQQQQQQQPISLDNTQTNLVPKTNTITSNNLNQQDNLNKKLDLNNQQKTSFQLQQIQQQANLVKQQQHFMNQLQSQPNQQVPPQSQQQAQPQRHQYQQKENTTSNQLLNNTSPQNGPNNTVNKQQTNTNTQQQQQQPQQQPNQNNPVLNQLQQIQNNQVAAVATGVANNPNKQNQAPGATNPNQTTQNPIPPPPGVGLVNPNNQYLISLPFNQNFPYFDQSQIDSTNLIHSIYNMTNVPPPGVGTTGAASGPQYPISDSKFARSEPTNTNTQLNSSAAAAVAAQLSQQQQAPINLIPNINNFPFLFHNYGYPNFYMPIPNGTQPTNQQQFQNKPPQAYQTNFGNNQAYSDEQNKDYTNAYQAPAPSQMKTSNSNLSNVNDINNAAAVNAAYQKNVEKTQPGGYHTPPPANYQNSLLNQQQPHPNINTNQGPQFAYITSMISTPGANIVHTGMQDNLSRNVGNNGTNSLKQMQKTNYQNSSWGQ